MTFKVVSSLKAEKDIVIAIDWYAEINKILANRFYNDLLEVK